MKEKLTKVLSLACCAAPACLALSGWVAQERRTIGSVTTSPPTKIHPTSLHSV